MNLEKIQLTDQYQASKLLSQNEEIQLFTIDFDNVANNQIIDDEINTNFVHVMLFFQSRKSSNDVSKVLSQYKIQDENSNLFVLILNF